MNQGFYEFLGSLLSEMELYKFLIYMVSLIVLISLPTLLSLLKESVISKKIKAILKSNNDKMIILSRESQADNAKISREIINNINKLSRKVELLSDKRNNILGHDNIQSFLIPIYKNISLRIYKDIDVMIYNDELTSSKKESIIIIKRNISVLFTKVNNMLDKYRSISGHKLSFYINEKWEHILFKAIQELLFNSKVPHDKLRIHLWNLLETHIDEFIFEFCKKMDVN